VLGLLITLLLSYLAVLGGRFVCERHLDQTHPAAVLGISGLVGLGIAGLITGIVGLLPYGVALAGFVLAGLLAASLAMQAFRRKLWLSPFGRRPQGAEWLALLAIAVPVFTGLVGTLAPSTTSDWDTIAYHLAVPKIWLHAGQIQPITFIHHSNFPGSIDLLYLWGLAYGGQAGAKAFTFVAFLLGVLAVFGLARGRYGAKPGCWATAAFASVPVVVWETGTGYIDVVHGLYAGLGPWVLFSGVEAGRKGEILVGGTLLGFAAGTKYTGLQALIAIGAVLAVLLVVRPNLRSLSKPIAGAAALAIVLAAPWYVRNTIWTGNPVFPFFYERFGGKHWTQLQADVYRNEQKTFGVPFDGPLSIPHAVLGLAYQPGRYINPGQKLIVVDGKPVGATGNPMGAIGGAILAGMVAGLVFWRSLRKPERDTLIEPSVLAWVGIGLLMWAFLSQQSRYGLSFAPPLAILAGGLIATIPIGRLLAALVVVQTAWTGYLAKDTLLTPERVRTAVGAEGEAPYLRRNLGFYEAAEALNAQGSRRVGLFDEVFGYYLDVPYFWAGFGHSDEMGYESMRNVDDFMASIERLGFDHLYVNLSALVVDRAFAERWLRSMGLAGAPEPLPEAETAKLASDPQTRWRPLMAEAVLQGRLHVESMTRSGMILRVEGTLPK